MVGLTSLGELRKARNSSSGVATAVVRRSSNLPSSEPEPPIDARRAVKAAVFSTLAADRPEPSGTEELDAELAALVLEFSGLADRLSDAATRLRSELLLPSADLTEACEHIRTRFANLLQLFRAALSEYALPTPEAGSRASSLSSLSSRH